MTSGVRSGEEQTKGMEMDLVICDDNSALERLKVAVRNLVSHHSNAGKADCESIMPRGFPAIILTPALADGSWARLVELARHYEDVGFSVVLVASNTEVNRWVETLDDESLRRDGSPLDRLPEKHLSSDPLQAEDDWSC